MASASPSAAPSRWTAAIWQRLKALIERFDPGLFSEHLAWSSHGGAYFGDLAAPAVHARDVLTHVVGPWTTSSPTLGRQMLIENPSAYITFASATMSETDFLARLSRQTGCGLLLDVNNVYVSAVNQGFDASRLYRHLSRGAGGRNSPCRLFRRGRPRGKPLLIDAHDSPVRDEVWALYDRAIRRTGDVPTLIEWDNDIPPWRRLSLRPAAPTGLWANGGYAMRCASYDACPETDGIAGAHVSRLAMEPNAAPAEVRNEARFAIHRNTVFVGLIETLRSTFPVIGRLVGEDFFRAAARAFAADHPPKSPVLAEYGEGFAGFLEEFEPARELPYLADVARLEWLRNLAFHAPDRAGSRFRPWRRFRPETWADWCSSSIRRRDLSRRRTRREHLGDQHHDADVEFIGPDLPGEAALVIRPKRRVMTLRLTIAEHGFVAALMCGKTLREASMTDSVYAFARLISTGALCGLHPRPTKTLYQSA